MSIMTTFSPAQMMPLSDAGVSHKRSFFHVPLQMFTRMKIKYYSYKKIKKPMTSLNLPNQELYPSLPMENRLLWEQRMEQ